MLNQETMDELSIIISPLLLYFEVRRDKKELLRKSSNIAGYKVFFGTDSEYVKINWEMMNKRRSEFSSVFTETRKSKSMVSFDDDEYESVAG